MLPSLPQDVFVHILDALDTQYTSGTRGNSDVWHPGRVSTLRSITLTSRTLCAFAQPRLFAHIDFYAGRDAQSRAARLLRYFSQEEGDGADSHSNELEKRRLQAIRSLRLRDGRGASKMRIPQTQWQPDLATPLGRLLALFADAPHLQLFSFEGDLWTLAGSGELVGYQNYIHIMSSKPSLRVLALSNVYDVPIDVFFTVQSHRQSTAGLRSVQISNVSFITRGSAEDSEIEAATAKFATPHPIECLKLGRLNFAHFFDMLHTRRTATDSYQRISPPCDVGPSLSRLKSLSLALSVVPAQMAALWNLVYGLRETLENLQIRNYESISDKLKLSALQQLMALRQTLESEKFISLKTLTLSTYIMGGPMSWADSAEGFRWGLPLLVDLLGMFICCPIPGSLRQLNLEIFFMGEVGPAQAQTDEPKQDRPLEGAAVDPVWRKLDTLLTSVICANPSVKISITLLPFFFVEHGNLVEAECPSRNKHWRSRAVVDAFGLDECLPTLFGKAPVDVRVDCVLSNKDMLTYLRSA